MLKPLRTQFRIAHRRTVIAAVVALTISLCMFACDVHHYPDFKGRALTPGDPNYPMVNPHPTQVVQFTAIMPPSISTEFVLRYEVAYITRLNPDGSLLAYESPPGCRWKPTDEFYLELPLTLERRGDTYHGSFALDHFRAGNCGWHFQVMLSPMLRIPAVTYRESFNDRPGDQANITESIWCTHQRKVAPQQPATRDKANQVIDCANLAFATGYIDAPLEFYQSFPETQRAAQGRVFIAQHAQSVTIEFHDIDPIYADYANRHALGATATINPARTF